MRSSILTLKRAKVLRRAITEPEAMLWSRLRRRMSGEHLWRRQHPLGPYVADFYCAAAKLVAEIDGHQHGDDAQRAHDRRRDHWMTSQGLTVQRITASSVYADADQAADGLRLLASEIVRTRH
jgi:very-short-patch-repair endonuclease